MFPSLCGDMTLWSRDSVWVSGCEVVEGGDDVWVWGCEVVEG